MQDRQKPIAEWMGAVMERRGISARAWSELAGLGKDTVSRAMRDNYEFVTSTTTIAKLADVLGETAPGVAGGIPSREVLSILLKELLPAVPNPKSPDDAVVDVLAQALRDTLLSLADDAEALSDPRACQALVRASIRRALRPSA